MLESGCIGQMDEHTPGVWVDLPVLVHWMAAKQDRADCSDVSRADENVADANTELHMRQPDPIHISRPL